MSAPPCRIATRAWIAVPRVEKLCAEIGAHFQIQHGTPCAHALGKSLLGAGRWAGQSSRQAEVLFYAPVANCIAQVDFRFPRVGLQHRAVVRLGLATTPVVISLGNAKQSEHNSTPKRGWAYDFPLVGREIACARSDEENMSTKRAWTRANEMLDLVLVLAGAHFRLRTGESTK